MNLKLFTTIKTEYISNSAKFSTDNKSILFADFLNVKTFDIKTKETSILFSNTGNTTYVCFDKTGEYIFFSVQSLENISTSEIRVFNRNLGYSINIFNSNSEDVFLDFTPNNKYLIIGSLEIFLFEVEQILSKFFSETNIIEYKKLPFYDYDYGVNYISCSNNSKYIAYSTPMGIGVIDIDKTKYLKGWGSYEQYCSIDFHPLNIDILCYSQNGGGMDYSKVVIIDNSHPNKLNYIKDITFTTKTTTIAIYSPDGKYLAVGFSDSSIELFETNNYSKIFEVKFEFSLEDIDENIFELNRYVNTLSFSFDSKYLLGCCYKSLQVWEISK
jgi:WD40 repeat protein